MVASTAKSIQILKNVAKPEMDASAKLPTRQECIKPLKECSVLCTLWELVDWPPQSPDLSPIENIWNVMKMKLKAMRQRPRSKAQLREGMFKIYDGLKDETISLHYVPDILNRQEAHIGYHSPYFQVWVLLA
ncbi:hypothetical protein HDV02_004770, partial [Globomyces sp. JEL0801]